MEMNLPALVITPHPVSLQGQRVLDARAAEFAPGETLAQLLARFDIAVGQQWAVSIGGVDVQEHRWHLVRPKHAHIIEVRRVMHKDVLRLVAVVALSYFTMGAGGLGVAGVNGATTTGLFAAGGAIGGGVWAAGAAFLAGSLIINKMLAPKQPGKQDQNVNPTYSLSGGRNRMRPYEPMGLVLGEPYAVPDLAAQPYTFFANGEHYLWQMFHLGLNCADATTLRIGQTPLSNYQGVTVLRNGLASGNSEFPALGTSVDSVQGGALNYLSPVTRTGSPGTVRLAVDLAAQLYTVTDEGAITTNYVNVTIFYREVGSVTWLPFTDAISAIDPVLREVVNGDGEGSSGYKYFEVVTPGRDAVPAGLYVMGNATQKPLRVTLERAVPPAQYEVQLQKYSVDEAGSSAVNTVEWVQLRSYQEDTANYDGQARIAVQIQATGQLNGALDELNGQLRAQPMDYWDGSGWVTATDRASGLCNPGAILLLLARGRFAEDGRRLFGLGYTDDQINIENLKQFMVHCKVNNFEFDFFLQEAMSINDLMDAVAYAGMAELSWPDGKIGVTFFSRDDPIEGIINMGTIKARSFEVSYDTMPTADEIVARYFDRERGDEWQPVRVKAPGVDVPNSTASLSLIGVSSETHAATLARFAMAQNIYQRKSVTLEMDLEYMTYRKGSVVALSHDMTQWGYSGRLLACEEAAGVITLTLDDIAPGEDPIGMSTSRYIGLRLPGEKQMRVFPVVAFSGEARTVTLGGVWPVGVPLPGADSDNPARDTVWIYDFKAVPGQRLMVASIEPNSNGARLGLVPISDEFWDFVETGEYQPPPNNSLLRPAPVILDPVVRENLGRQGNTFFTELTVQFDVRGPFQRAELWGAVGDGDIAPPLALLTTSQSQNLSWRGGLDERWHLKIRVFADSRQAVPYELIYDVRGLREPPADVTGLSVNGNTVSWDPVDVPDLAGYAMRFQFGNSTWWDTAVPLHKGLITESPYELTRRPQGDVTVLIKAIDTTGNESVNAAAFAYGFAPTPVSNAADAFPQHPTFPGDITNGAVSGGDLEALGADVFYEPADGPMYLAASDLMYGNSQYGEMVYEFSVISAQAGRLVLLYTISADSLLVEYQARGADAMYEPDADLMYDPGAELLYGEFGDWAVWPGSIEFNGQFEVRFRFTLAGGLTQGVIYDLTAVVDAPEVSEQIEDVAIEIGGTRLPIANTYRVIRTVQLTLQAGGGVGTRVLDKNPTLGPLVEVINSAGTSVAGVLDADIRGY